MRREGLGHGDAASLMRPPALRAYEAVLPLSISLSLGPVLHSRTPHPDPIILSHLLALELRVYRLLSLRRHSTINDRGFPSESFGRIWRWITHHARCA